MARVRVVIEAEVDSSENDGAVILAVASSEVEQLARVWTDQSDMRFTEAPEVMSVVVD